MFMHDKGVFIFGIRIVETRRDAISRLPLELSWKIFSYLDKLSLRNAKHSHKTWARIILADRKLRSRLNKFELADKLGSESLAKFYKRNKRKLKKEMGKNYLPRCEDAVQSTKTMIAKSKRAGEALVIHMKRYKLF
ncbi:uncharacterized protein LOC115440895 [Manduca sexta]|uniref:F-box domain-containing protein n=1 Tax=Manduca sexta TaxID=7130 RepID=A0A921YVD9_MANSE|nr:uncharacterized protein LOC115440895 [Manduca sexta]KAG6446066.1 hypothetical protein O3G_MSEX004236 [Manduca sexta]